MTPQQEAKYLIDKYSAFVHVYDFRHDEPLPKKEYYKQVKKLVYSVINDKINALHEYGTDNDELQNMDSVFSYWQNVANEVEKFKG